MREYRSGKGVKKFIMGRNITAWIPETISPIGINETRCGKNSREKRDFMKSVKGSFLEERGR